MEKVQGYNSIINITENKKIKSMSFNVVAEDFEGTFNVTDLQLQGGSVKTGYVPNTKEFFKPMTCEIDEYSFISTVSKPALADGIKPVKWTGVKNKFFNIVGRGHETIAISNVFHNDYRIQPTTNFLNLVITPKEDYDLLRISSNIGGLIEGRVYYEDLDEVQPLNYQYSRELYIPAGKANQQIVINGQNRKITINGKEYQPLREVIQVGDGTIPLTNPQFPIAISGVNRYRIEFYKEQSILDSDGKPTLTYYGDVGIGYYGYAEVIQREEGVKF